MEINSLAIFLFGESLIIKVGTTILTMQLRQRKVMPEVLTADRNWTSCSCKQNKKRNHNQPIRGDDRVQWLLSSDYGWVVSHSIILSWTSSRISFRLTIFIL